ncbi:MAG: DUF4810 domain-containing protein [Thermodesulfobacteriota bacterium]|nr:DUF4810 domain-containing protein [Thermodesulfobacteriota bacterium]
MVSLRTLMAFAAAVLLIGCASSTTLYEWGRYEDAIYDMYLKPGKVSKAQEIERLEQQIEETVSACRLVPPGLHAHVAYLYVSDGDYIGAMVHLQSEKTKFPESVHFIDGIIERMQK